MSLELLMKHELTDRVYRLRVHATQEWHDLYKKSTNDELQSFLDRYTKDIENGWEQTPKVRTSLLRFNKVSRPKPDQRYNVD